MKIILIICIYLISFANLAIASSKNKDSKDRESLLSRLLAPGPLKEAHKHLEKTDCLKCHVPYGAVPTSKCLDCHKEIKAHIDNKVSFHGLMDDKNCIKCHSEHKGRSFDAFDLDVKKFDHSKTGFILDGKHKNLECKDCHKSERKFNKSSMRFFGEDKSCKSCHMKDDPHRFKGEFASKDCNQCHGTKSFKDDVKFDHFKDTGFMIDKTHANLKCASCHIEKARDKVSRYQWSKKELTSCVGCHKNPHEGKLSANYNNKSCLYCHKEGTWKIEKFDHAQLIGYPLSGAHKDVDCAGCHNRSKKKSKKIARKKDFHWLGNKKSCESCHKPKHDNFTELTKGNNCESCHRETSWFDFSNTIAGFDHDTTGFPLVGKHKDVTCAGCHRKDKSKEAVFAILNKHPSNSCQNCHKDPHKGQTKGFACSTCHSPKDWLSVKNYHKDVKLKGAHSTLSCQSCHDGRNLEVVDMKDCLSCHKKDDPHKGRLTNCTECHNQVDWQLTHFNHSKTAFPLRGVHRVSDCNDCHFDGVFKGKPSRCIDCHSNVIQGLNPPHTLPQYEDCKSCHNEFTFSLP